MAQIAPIAWAQYAANGDSVTFVRAGHTVTKPSLALFTRKAPIPNGQGGYSVPTYNVRFINGHVDANGVPLKERSIVEINVRHPVGASATDITAAIAEAATMLADAEFVNDATSDLMFPRES